MINNIENIFDLSSVWVRKMSEERKDWYKGYSSYLNGIYDELDEVKIEINAGKKVYLEDELGDVFWDYCCLLESLELEGKINKQKVFERCNKKLSERTINRKPGELWEDIKKRQKEELKQEQDRLDGKSLVFDCSIC